MKRISTLIIILFISVTYLFAANNPVSELAKKYKEAEETYLKKNFFDVISLADRINSISKNNYADYYKALSLIKLLPLAKDEKEFNKQLNICEEILSDYDYSALSCEFGLLKANLLMMKISKFPAEAPAISKEIFSIFGIVEQINPNSPRLFLTRGVMLFHMPEVFGGSKKKAMEQFILAKKLFANEEGNITWGKYENLVWMAKIYESEKNFSKAYNIYKSILKEVPDYSWVKNNLLPKLIETRKNSVKLFIRFEGLPNNKGALRLALYDKKSGYDNSEAYKAKSNYKIKDRSTEIVFEDLNPGIYAIKCYHDENDNEMLDTNTFGIPNESYGFSNNVMGMFGPPSFEDAKFKVSLNDTTIVIKMK